MNRTKIDPKREHRIDYEVIADCYNEEEQSLGWYYYLENKCTFPFQALLKNKKIVEITSMAPEEDCEKEMYVYAKFEDDELPIVLFDITPLSSTNEKTKEAIEDWHYWIKQGYQF